MRKFVFTAASLTLALGGFNAAHASLIQDWNFNTAPDGTDINNAAVVNSVVTGSGWTNNAWVSDVYSSTGELLIGGRIGADATWASAGAANRAETGTIWHGFYGVRWQLEGGTVGETIELGVSDGGQVDLAGVRLARTSTDAGTVVQLSGFSDTGDDVATTVGLTSTASGSIDAISDAAYDFVIEFDNDAEDYTVYYKTTTDTDFTELGSGTLAATHHYEATAIRTLGNAQSLGSNPNNSPQSILDLPNQEHFAIDRIVVSDTSLLPEPVIPEPASAALVALGGLTMLARRRKA